MKLWIRGFAVLCLLAVLTVPGVRADVEEWAQEQMGVSPQQLRIDNQREALGVEPNADIKAMDITERCSIRVSTGDKSRLTSNSVSKGWSYSSIGDWVSVDLPSGVTPGAIRIEWRFDPKGYELEEYDADMHTLRTRTEADTFPGIYTMFALLPETRSVRIRMTAKDQVIVRLVLYSEGVLPNNVQTWLPPVEKADMMVFSTHQDDEVIFLGGTIPYSDVVCGRPTVTVYMTNCSRSRRREALECLWVMGSRHYPEFINLKDKRVSSIDEGIRLWGGRDNILKEMVERIRRYKPEVIVTQDFNGEYGHNQHRIMARAMPYAIEAAADPTKYPDSYRIYGAWQVKKLYIHLYKKNEIRMDWLTPQPALGGLTLLKVAQNGMEKHASQTKYYSVKDGGKYDNARFGLYMTQVGADVTGGDFFENIEPDASAKYLAEHPEAEMRETDLNAQTASPADGSDREGSDDVFAPEADTSPEPDEPAEAEDHHNISGKPERTVDAAPARPAGSREKQGSVLPAVAMIGLGLAGIGYGSWRFLSRSGLKHPKRKRRNGTAGHSTQKARGRQRDGRSRNVI